MPSTHLTIIRTHQGTSSHHHTQPTEVELRQAREGRECSDVGQAVEAGHVAQLMHEGGVVEGEAGQGGQRGQGLQHMGWWARRDLSDACNVEVKVMFKGQKQLPATTMTLPQLLNQTDRLNQRTH